MEAGQVVEYWSDAAETALLEPLLTVTIPVDDLLRQVVTLERWTYDPESSETRTTDWGSLVILVDVGTLTVTLDGSERDAARPLPRTRAGTVGGERPATPETSLTLGPGDGLVVPHVTRFTAGNDGAVPATAFVVGISTPAPQWKETETGHVSQSMGVVSRTVLAGGMTVVLPSGEVTIALGRAALAPGAVLPPRRVDIAELAAVEAGEVAVTADGAAAWATSGEGAGSRIGEAGTLAAGTGAHLDPGSAAGYRAVGDTSVEMLLVAIDGVAADPGTATP